MVQWAFFAVHCGDGDELLMVGRTLTTLKRNCLNLLTDLVGEKHFTYSISQKQAELYGRKVWLEGANDERSETKIRGLTLKGAYVDELTTIPQSFYLMLLSRLSKPKARFFATTNPDNPNHYVNQEIILNDNIDRQAVKFLLDDNTFLEKAYIDAIKKEYTGVYYDRFIRGEFIRAEGLIFKNFADDPGKWIIDHAPEDLKYITYGIDYGGNKSKTVFVACGIRRSAKGIVILDEYRVSGDGITPERIETEFVAFVRSVVKDYPNVKQTYAFTDEPQYITNGIAIACRKAGLMVQVVLANKEEITTRIYAKVKMLTLGLWQVMRKCQMIIYSTSNQLWDEKKDEDTRLDIEPAVNDVADAEEYSWQAFIDEIGVRA